MRPVIPVFKAVVFGLCLGWFSAQAESGADADTAFTVIGAQGLASVRVLTQSSKCPVLHWEGGHSKRTHSSSMHLRAPAATVAERRSGGQPEQKAAVFNVTACEAEWPQGASRAWMVNTDRNAQKKTEIPAPQKTIERVILVADTGCRLKASEGAFQSCNDGLQWPFARIAKQAALKRPDLVIHLGDLHYRESPCPESQAGCKASPWGYGFDAWNADFFKPAEPLLRAAPWVFVRGNHESCARAGQGWYRFLDTPSWSTARSCDDPRNDADADHSEPYAVALDETTQFIVFDSSKASGKALPMGHPDFSRYMVDLMQVDRLAAQSTSSIFLSHHPLLAYGAGKTRDKAKPGGNLGLQSVFAVRHPDRLFAEHIDLALHGHVHLFQSLSFSSDHPGTFVLGNSGSANEGFAPDRIHSEFDLYPGAVIEKYTGSSRFGFALLERQAQSGAGATAHGEWLLTEFSVDGEVVSRCQIQKAKSHCEPIRAPG